MFSQIKCEEIPVSCPALYLSFGNLIKAFVQHKGTGILSKHNTLRAVAMGIDKGYSCILRSFTKQYTSKVKTKD